MGLFSLFLGGFATAVGAKAVGKRRATKAEKKAELARQKQLVRGNKNGK